ncbi:hypothetical protein XCR1_840130 [Xenorhabdus cabanillasii JM26]|uniref:Uncharacterized protein n=1 Tax=Xenorhabdus cabanillasii JM26 TaxID=1427517 RepID=W1JC27_9GAMM|nr:hypothetical protein XCR1_840130 [Xenorhabdus cabanillasii JM26]
MVLVQGRAKRTGEEARKAQTKACGRSEAYTAEACRSTTGRSRNVLGGMVPGKPTQV